MQELLLFGQAVSDIHHELLQQLAGIARMQPVPFTERHLIFRALPPAALARVQQGGGSQGVQPPEIQRTKNALQGPLFHVQLVRDITDELELRGNQSAANGKSELNGARKDPKLSRTKSAKANVTPWTIEFRDIPDPGTHPVTFRHMSRTVVEDGSPIPFLTSLGYEYTTQYLIRGHKFYADDTILSLHQLFPLPTGIPPSSEADIISSSILPSLSDLKPLDLSGAFVLQASIEIQPDMQNTSTNPELRTKATQQLLKMKETLKETVELKPGERLALDTRVNLRR